MCQPLFWSLRTFSATKTTLKGHMHATSTSEASLNITSKLSPPNWKALQVFKVSFIFSRGEKCDINELKVNNSGFCPTPHSRHLGGILLAGWTLHLVPPDLCESNEGCPEDLAQSKGWEDFWQYHKNRESAEGVVDPDWSMNYWIFKGKTCGYLLRQIEINLLLLDLIYMYI